MNAHAKWQWTDERVTALRDLRARGFSASEIMREIGAPSRNTVIGKSARLGLPKATPVPRDKVEKAPRPATPKDRAYRLGLNPKRIAKRAKANLAPVPEGKPSKQNLHPIAAKIVNKARERNGSSLAPDIASVSEFDTVVEAKRPEAPGVLFLERRTLQCAMPLPGWDDLSVTGKLVCGLPTVGSTSWCKHCLPVVTTPSTYRDFMNRKVVRGLKL